MFQSPVIIALPILTRDFLKSAHFRSADYNDIMLDIRQAALPHDPLDRYNSMVASGDLRFDAQQQQVAARLSELASKLAQHQMEMDKFQVSARMQLVVFPLFEGSCSTTASARSCVKRLLV